LTGSIPSLTTNVKLRNIWVFFTQCIGSIPNLDTNIKLENVNFMYNQLTGNIPNLSNCTVLNDFRCNNNSITGFTGSVPASLGSFYAQNNLLTQSAVNAILAAFVAAGKNTGVRYLQLDGTGNASPTGGVNNSDKLILEGRGWTVLVNP